MNFEGLPARHTRHKIGKGDEKSDTETYNVGLSAQIPQKKGTSFSCQKRKGLFVDQESDLWYHQQLCLLFLCAGECKGVVNAWEDIEPQLRKVKISFILIQ